MDHSFDPKPKDLGRLPDVRLLFVVGLGLDGWAERIVRGASRRPVQVVALGPQLDPQPVPLNVLGLADAEEDPHSALEAEERGPPDPHFFLDPVRMARAAGLIADALAALDPEREPAIRGRALEVQKEMAALDVELQAEARSWSRRTIVTFHGSMFYFAGRYGLNVAAVIEPLPGREPSPRALAIVLRQIRKAGVAALFTEPQLDPRPAQLIASEAGLPLYQLDPIGGGSDASTYEALLRKNARVLGQALR
jgi:ABC-type Zn uptake system ZnuABC Zn-binding protein ZnuA